LLKKHYNLKSPSDILKNALEFIYPDGSSFFDYHPTPERRIKKIKENVDKK